MNGVWIPQKKQKECYHEENAEGMKCHISTTWRMGDIWENADNEQWSSVLWSVKGKHLNPTMATVDSFIVSSIQQSVDGS